MAYIRVMFLNLHENGAMSNNICGGGYILCVYVRTTKARSKGVKKRYFSSRWSQTLATCHGVFGTCTSIVPDAFMFPRRRRDPSRRRQKLLRRPDACLSFGVAQDVFRSGFLAQRSGLYLLESVINCTNLPVTGTCCGLTTDISSNLWWFFTI